MGLLSDPSLMPRKKWSNLLSKYHSKVYGIFYICSIVWFCCLGHNDFNHNTYLSENALSPGLVYPEMKQYSSRLVQQYVDELRLEMEKYKSSTPYTWIAVKMQQIGLETYFQNYTLKYPFAGGKMYNGQNIYGILRSPRGSSTEGIILSAPYRSPSSIHPDITASVPYLLAFAEFARKKNYWAKDLIFLVTEQEQLGMHAFLEAYFNMPIANPQYENQFLNYGSLPARAGILQAALNLEIQDSHIDYINVKIEGLNGHLPNLDLFNVVQRITSREGIPSGYKQHSKKKWNSQKYSIGQNIKNMVNMFLSQVSGVPNGNHGLFHRHRIEALTLEGIANSKRILNSNKHQSLTLPMLKVIEGISRSLNNLLERFHQSYFFYALVQNDRFVSIGDYMPSLALLIVPIFVEAFLKWMIIIDTLSAKPIIKKNKEQEEENEIIPGKIFEENQKMCIMSALLYIILVCGMGNICQHVQTLNYVVNSLYTYGLSTPASVTIMVGFWTITALFLPVFCKLSVKTIEWLHLSCLIALGTALIVIGVLNFALAYLIAIVTVPMVIIRSFEKITLFGRIFSIIYCLLLNPLVFVYCFIFVISSLHFPEISLLQLCVKTGQATMDAILYCLIDNLIYGNWFYVIITSVMFPLWCGFWAVTIYHKTVSNQLEIIRK